MRSEKIEDRQAYRGPNLQYDDVRAEVQLPDVWNPCRICTANFQAADCRNALRLLVKRKFAIESL